MTESPLETSKNIWKEAITQYPPYATLIALSGGKDSITTYYVAKALNLPINGIIHIRTRTGILKTTEFVRWFAEREGIPYHEGDAGNTYEKRVLERGFFGRGQKAHSFAYHLLKKTPLERTISREIRQRKRDRNVLILNGARLGGSENRLKNFTSSPIRARGRNVWVNLLQHWGKSDCEAVRMENNAPCNPVNKELCRSGECFCGTTQSQAERIEAATLFPEWGRWLDNLERKVMEKFPWRWGDHIPKSWEAEKQGQLRLFPHQLDSPMCSDCNSQ